MTRAERHDAAVARMVDQVGARLEVLRMTARTTAESLGLDVGLARRVLPDARAAVVDGSLGYALLVAEKPAA